MKIEVYSKSHCPYCVDAKHYLTAHGIPFVEYILDDDTERHAFYDRVGAGVHTVPQVYEDGIRLGGLTELLKSDLVSRHNLSFDADF